MRQPSKAGPICRHHARPAPVNSVQTASRVDLGAHLCGRRLKTRDKKGDWLEGVQELPQNKAKGAQPHGHPEEGQSGCHNPKPAAAGLCPVKNVPTPAVPPRQKGTVGRRAEGRTVKTQNTPTYETPPSPQCTLPHNGWNSENKVTEGSGGQSL